MSDGNTSEEVMLRDTKTGRWIKRLEKDLSLSDNFIPITFLQVVHNEIHYADTSFIISEIINHREKEKVEFIETAYNNILDCLDNYRAYSSGIEKVFTGCESSANEFDNKIRRMCEEIDHKKISELETDPFLNIVRAYIKVLFVYLYSALVLHKDKVKNETVIYGKIKNVKAYIQDILELILIPNNWNGSKRDYSLSVYPIFMYSPDLNIRYIDELTKYDRRFESSLEVIQDVNSATLDVVSREWDSNIEFTGKFEKMTSENPKIVFIDELIKLLNDIDRLGNIREEIGDIDDLKVLKEFDSITKQG